jgi:hypothetical protein
LGLVATTVEHSPVVDDQHVFFIPPIGDHSFALPLHAVEMYGSPTGLGYRKHTPRIEPRESPLSVDEAAVKGISAVLD